MVSEGRRPEDFERRVAVAMGAVAIIFERAEAFVDKRYPGLEPDKRLDLVATVCDFLIRLLPGIW